jgi:hypothetical protein
MWSRVTAFLIFLAGVLVCSGVTFAQVYGTDGGAPGAWPTKDLPKALSAPKPYDPHDLSGVWASPSEQEDVHWLGEHGGQGGINGPDYWVIRPPLTDWGQEQLDSHFPGPNGNNDAKGMGNRARIDGFDNDPLSRCDPLGFPHAFWAALDRAFEFIPAKDRMLMHIQYHEVWRQIWTDGRPLPKDPDPAWNGYSIGHWEGDTFIVESTGYDPDSWFDRMGDPRSPDGVLVERWHRADNDTLELQMTLNDPKAYTKPWVGDKQLFKRQKFALYEEICVPSEEESFHQNQRDVALGGSSKTAKVPNRK